MEHIIVHGGYKLQGNVKIEGGKNATLPILAASILAEDTTTISNVPILTDVLVMHEILKKLNIDVHFNEDSNEVTIDTTKKVGFEAKYEFASRLRASFLIMGPLLARAGHAKVAMPGGCAIGKRPIDLHLKGFEALGATVVQKNGYIEVFADELIGNNIYLEIPSLGATENIMMAAVKAKGTTVISNAARDPEVVELAAFLNKMGAKIFGAGTKTVRIEGVDVVKGIKFTVVQDRHEAGTFMIAAAMTEGDVLIEKAIYEDNAQVISKLRAMGATIREDRDGIRVIGSKNIKPVDIIAEPHPGFPTDLQSPFTAIQVYADGTSSATETVFEKRFQHFNELQMMGADVKITGNIAIMNGKRLVGADVVATDLRTAAALILAGLRAKGVTRVSNLKYLDRGYYKFHEKLRMLGARIERVKSIDSDKKWGKMEIIQDIKRLADGCLAN